MNDDDRIAYLSGDDVMLPDDERAELDELLVLLGDRSLWAEPSADLEDRVVATIVAEAAAGGSGPGVRTPPPAPRTLPVAVPSRRARTWQVIAAAAAIVLAVGVTASFITRRSPSGERFSMTLAPPDGSASNVSGTVDLRRTSSGWRIQLDAPELPRLDAGRFYEAWLRNTTGVLVPIGTFNEGDDVVLWAGVSPREFSTLTVTEESADGDQVSSGVRVLVGTIDTADLAN